MRSASFYRTTVSTATVVGALALLSACGGSSTDPAASELHASQDVTAGTTTTSPSADAPTSPTTPSAPSAAQPDPAAGVPGPDGHDASEYRLTFSEEFNNGFDRSVWNDTIWYEQGNPTINYAVEDGSLKIWPQRDASGNFFNRTIDTDGKYYQTYGYFEIEAKLPKGVGTWPAFWLFNHINERRPEIDVMEAYPGGAAPWGFTDSEGVRRPQAYAPTVWKGDYEGQMVGSRQYDTGMDLSTTFNTYGVKWEPNKQTFYFNGEEILTVNVTMGDPMYLMLDLWYGSASGQPGNLTPQGKDNSFEIKYVRAWQFR